MESIISVIASAFQDLIFVLNEKGEFVEYLQANNEEVLFKERDQFINKHYRDVLPPDVCDKLALVLTKVNDSDLKGEFEYSLPFPNNKLKWYNAQVTYLNLKGKGKKGKNVYVLSVKNITAQKEQEIKLKENETRLSLIFNNSSDMQALMSVHPNDTLIAEAMNQSYITALKLIFPNASTDLIGRERKEYLTSFGLQPENIEEEMPAFRKVIETCAPLNYEVTIPTQTGDYYLDVSLIPVVSAENVCTHILWNGRDITSRKMAEKSLAENEERLRMALAAGNSGIFDLDIPTGKVKISDEHAIMLGYDPVEFKNNNIFSGDRMHPQDKGKARSAFDAYVNGRTNHYYVEFRQLSKTDEWRWIASTGKIVSRDAEGKPIRMVGTHTDISDRKQSEQTLYENERLLRTIADNFPNSYLSIIEKDFTVGFTSGQAFKKTGLDANQFIGLSIDQVFGEQTAFVKERFSQTFEGKETSFELFTNNQHQLYKTVPLVNEDGTINRILSVAEDITERKKAEVKLLFQATLIEEVADAIIASDEHFNMTLWNKAAEDLYGWKKEEILGRNGLETLKTEWPEADVENMRRSVAETGRRQGEATQLCKDGRRIPVEISSLVLRDKQGKISGYVSVNRDITKRKQSEQLVRESQQTLQEMGDNYPGLFWVRDMKTGSIIYASPTWKELLGEQPAIGSHFSALLKAVHPEDIELVRRGSPELSNMNFDQEMRMVDASGQMRWYRLRAFGIKDSTNQIYRVAGIGEEITQRKTAEGSLIQSEERLRLALKAAKQGIYDLDLATGGVTVTDEYSMLLGYDPITFTETYATWVERLHPEEKEHVLAKYEGYLKGELAEFKEEFRMRTNSVNWLWILSFGKIVSYDTSGKPMRVIGTVTDISERKKIEEELKIKENAIDASLNGIAFGDLQGTIYYVNDSFQKIWGYTNRNQIIGKNATTFWENPQEAQQVIVAVMTHGYWIGEMNAIRFDGTKSTLQLMANLIQDAQGKPVALMASFVDVTEQKKTEQSLKDSEAKHRALIENISDLILIIDENGINLWNSPSVRQYGIIPEDVVGQSAFEFVHPDDQHRLNETLKYVVNHPGETIKLPSLKVLTPTGELVFFDDTFTYLPDAPGIQGIVVTVHDITQSKRAQIALQENESRLLTLFENSPIPVWEEDFSEVKKHIEALKSKGIVDFRAHWNEHTDDLMHCVSLVKVTDINQTSVAFFEANDKAEVSRNLPGYFTEASLPVFKEELIALANGQTYFQSEIEIITSSSGLKQVLLSLAIMPGYESTLSKILVSFVDITERKKAEQQVRESQQTLQEMGDNYPGLFWVREAGTGAITYASPSWKDLLEKQPIIGSHFSTLFKSIHPADVELYEQAISKAEYTGWDTEFRMVDQHGTIRWFHFRAFPILNEKGITYRVSGFGEEITERKKAEALLINSEERLRVALQAANQGIYDFDLSTNEINVTDQYAIMLGFDPGSFKETFTDWANRLHPEDKEKTFASYESYLKGEIDGYKVEFRMQTKSGNWICVLSCYRLTVF